MTDLATFLRARLDDDEAVAQKSSSTDVSKWDYLLWARFSRARVLADIDAKRRIIDLHFDDAGWCPACGGSEWPCSTLRLLASVWSNHPDYDAERWAP